MTLTWLLVSGVVLLFGFVVIFGAPYVPSHAREVRRSFKDLYRVGKDDTVVDLGSGDGVVLKEAVRSGAQAYGYELNPILVLLTKLRLLRMARAQVRLADMWRTPLPDTTTLVYVFSVSRDSARLARHLQRETDRLGRPIHVMTYGVGLKGREALRASRGHILYEMVPLQGGEA